MSMTDTVLVLSRDDSRARDLKTILEFIGKETVLDDGASRERLASNDEAALEELGLAVISAEDDRELREDIELVCHAEAGLPILVVGDPDLGGLDKDCHDRVLARVEWPPITPS